MGPSIDLHLAIAFLSKDLLECLLTARLSDGDDDEDDVDEEDEDEPLAACCFLPPIFFWLRIDSLLLGNFCGTPSTEWKTKRPFSNCFTILTPSLRKVCLSLLFLTCFRPGAINGGGLFFATISRREGGGDTTVDDTSSVVPSLALPSLVTVFEESLEDVFV